MGEILVEVRPANVSGDIARKSAALPEPFVNRVNELAGTINKVAAQLQEHLESGMAAQESQQWHLDNVGLGFELALQAEAGVVIARASTGATFSVTLTWSRGSAR
jgi:hypothetical protein